MAKKLYTLRCLSGTGQREEVDGNRTYNLDAEDSRS